MPGAAYSLTQVISLVRYPTITQKYIFEEGFENLFLVQTNIQRFSLKTKSPGKELMSIPELFLLNLSGSSLKVVPAIAFEFIYILASINFLAFFYSVLNVLGLAEGDWFRR